MDLLVPGVGKNLRDGLSIGIGFALLSYLIMLTGSLAGFSLTLIGIVIIPFVLTIHKTIARLKNLPGRIREIAPDLKLRGDLVLVFTIGILFLLDLINAGNAAVGWDAAVHHYAIPKRLLLAGILIPDFGNPFAFYPSIMEMLFTLGLGVGGEFLAGAMSWIYLIPMSLAFLSIGNCLGNRRIGLWAIILFLGAPLTFELPFSGVIDLPFLTYCLLALALLLESTTEINLKKSILIGIMIGCASATKHLGLLFLPAFLVIAIWKFISERKPASTWISASILIALFTILIPLPWYIYSYYWTGDPIFPYLSNLANSSGGLVGSLSVESFASSDYPRSIPGFLGYLWHLTMDYSDLRPWYLAIHPAWLALFPPAIFYAFNKQRGPVYLNLRLILVLSLMTMAINFFLAPAFPRYMFPTWTAMAILSAYALSEIRKTWPGPGKILMLIVLVLPFIVVFTMAGKRTIEIIPQYFSREARSFAILESFEGYATIQWANVIFDFEHDLILTTDPKLYYLTTRAIVVKPGIESSMTISWSSEPSEIIANWRTLGVTHFILDTTLESINGGFALLVISEILGDREAAWMDAPRTIEAGNEFGLDGFFTEEKLVEFGHYGGLPVVYDGTPGGNHLVDRERIEILKSRGTDYAMAEVIIKFIGAGMLVEEFRSGPGWGVVLYKVNLPVTDSTDTIDFPDVTEWGTDYESGPSSELNPDDHPSL